MHKYQIVLWWSEEDGCFLAKAPELPRCMADGDTPEAALCELQMVIATWLELARDRGWEIPQPAGHLLPVRDETHWYPAALSAANGAAPEQHSSVMQDQLETNEPRLNKVGNKRKKHVETTHVI